MYKFCSNKIKDITFVLIDVKILTDLREVLNRRFLHGDTLPGTMSFHHYRPLSETTIAFKRTSEHTDIASYNLITDFKQPSVKPMDMEHLKPTYFVA